MKFKASELKNEQELNYNSKTYMVVSNHINDVLFLCNINAEFYDGFHLFYDDPEDIKFAKDCLGIDLTA